MGRWDEGDGGRGERGEERGDRGGGGREGGGGDREGGGREGGEWGMGERRGGERSERRRRKKTESFVTKLLAAMQDPQILTIKGKIKILEVGKGRADRIKSTGVDLDRA